MKTYHFDIEFKLDFWWDDFSYAICNSRGYKTERQKIIEQSRVMKDLKRDLEAALFANLSAPSPTE